MDDAGNVGSSPQHDHLNSSTGAYGGLLGIRLDEETYNKLKTLQDHYNDLTFSRSLIFLLTQKWI